MQILEPGTYFLYKNNEKVYIVLDEWPAFNQYCRSLEDGQEYTFTVEDLKDFKILSEKEAIALAL